MGAFAAAALSLAAAGLGVMPLGGADGKVPLVKWRRWKRRPGPAFIRSLIKRHTDANIGVICGLSCVTVVDIDDLDLLPQMIERFGDTPLRTHTPSGGVHLWYRSSGEGCRNLRTSEGLAVDIKGIGGQVVVPPSVRFTGEHAGRSYGFLTGSWDELKRLPAIFPGTRPQDRAQGQGSAHPASVPSNPPIRLRAVKEGYRNDVLFCSLLRHAKGSDDNIEALLDTAETINADFDPPLSADEVAKTVVSAWKYETTDSNWVGREQRVYTLRSEWIALAAQRDGGDGHLLFSRLRMAHWGHSEFAVSPKAMAREQTIPGWGPKRYRAALGAITDAKLLNELHHGGRRPGDHSLFSFSTAVIGSGARGEPNITRTPSSAAVSPPERARRGEERVAKTAGRRQ
jgi:hypothetical protein